MEVNVLQHTYSAYIAPTDGPETQIARDYAFRTEQAALSVLNNFSLFADSGAMQVCGLTICCGTGLNAQPWNNSGFATQTGVFGVNFTATPSISGMDAVMGLSAAPASAFTDFACLLRFGLSGYIEMRSGDNYISSGISYKGGTQYYFRLSLNVPAHTYAVWVTLVGSAEQLAGSGLAFRTEQGNITSLANFGFIADSQGASVRVCDFVLSGSVIMQDSFAGSDGVITSYQYYTTQGGNGFPYNGTSAEDNPSQDWEAGSGWLYRQSNWGYSGRPIDWQDRYFFRANTRNFFAGQAQFVWAYRSAPWGQDGYAVLSTDAVDIWLRYQTEYNLYALQFDRTDGMIKAKRKVPAKNWSGNSGAVSNYGVYYTIRTDSQQPVLGAGQLAVRWSDVQGLLPAGERSKPQFPYLAHDSITPYNFSVAVRNIGNSVQIQLFRAGVLVFSATDDGNSAPYCEDTGLTLGQDLAAGSYNSVPGWQPSWGLPITAPGATGFRADNVKCWFSNFMVTAL